MKYLAAVEDEAVNRAQKFHICLIDRYPMNLSTPIHDDKTLGVVLSSKGNPNTCSQ